MFNSTQQPLSEQRIVNVLSILALATNRNITLSRAAQDLGFSDDYVSDFKRRHSSQSYTQDIYGQYIDLMLKYETQRSRKTSANQGQSSEQDIIMYGLNDVFKYKNPIVHNPTIDAKQAKDINVDDNYDKRSTCGENRDPNDGNKIINYWYKILLRDQTPFMGTLTREQMECIHAHYPYVTASNCSQYFPYLTFIQFKLILRVFNINKTRLFPKSVLEEKTEEEIAEFALKAKEHASLKKMVEMKPLFIEKELRKTQQEVFELKEEKDWLKETIGEFLSKLQIKDNIRIEYKDTKWEKGLFIYLSDIHVGASNKGSQFGTDYNQEILFARFKKILQEIYKLKTLYGVFDSIFVVNLGDALDGFNGETTRGGHGLPQNMDNREQFKTYLDLMIWFFNELHYLDGSNNIEYITVGDDNHGGDFGYSANLALKYLFEYKFPDVKFTLFEKFIEHFFYGTHAILACHGKDKKNMKNNLPLHLDAKTDAYFINYMKMNKIRNESVLVVKGDLHQHTTQIGKNFRYTNMPSIFGGSCWTEANFGYTQPAFVYQILDKNEVNVVEGYLGLD